MLNHPVPDEHLTAIGDVTVSFALLESQFQGVAHHLLAEPQRISQILTVELSFKNLRALVASLCIERFGKESEWYRDLRPLLVKANKLEGIRNGITHSIWACGPKLDPVNRTVTRVKATAKEAHGFKFSYEHVTAEQIREVAREIKRLAHDVSDLQWRLAAVPIEIQLRYPADN